MEIYRAMMASVRERTPELASREFFRILRRSKKVVLKEVPVTKTVRKTHRKSPVTKSRKTRKTSPSPVNE